MWATVAWMAGNTFDLRLPNIQFPVIGAVAWIGITFGSHILIGAWSMGVVIIAPTCELIGVARRDPRWDRYAHAISSVNLKLFSLGAVFASFAVFSLTGLYPNFFIRVMTIFFWPMLYAFLSWFVTFAALLIYVTRWERWAEHKARHIATGYVGGLVEQSFLFFIVGLDSYMLTPGNGIGLSAFFNPSYWPELLHRFVGNLSWASYLIAAVYIATAALRWERADAPYYRWAAKLAMTTGFVFLIPQVLIGFLYAEAIRQASPGAFSYSFTGGMAWMWIVQQALLGIVLLGTNVYLWQTRERPHPLAPGLTAATAFCSLLSALPSAAYPAGVFWVRYVFLALSVLLTVAHLVFWKPWLRPPRPDLGRAGRWAVGTGAVTAVLLFLFMGIVRETTKTAGRQYTVYGKATQSQSQNMFTPPSTRFFP
jgi:cytochrome d ubiquinol oxidase subunit I